MMGPPNPWEVEHVDVALRIFQRATVAMNVFLGFWGESRGVASAITRHNNNGFSKKDVSFSGQKTDGGGLKKANPVPSQF